MRTKLKWLPLLLLAGCAGAMRDCKMACASNQGADWIVVQRDIAGASARCWKLVDVSIGDSESVDGIYWQTPEGNIITIAGWFDRAQVERSGWAAAAKSLDVDLSVCK